MANFDDFKKVATEKAEILAGKAAELAKVAAEKTKVMAKTGKLNAEILAEKENIRKSYQELGKIYYDYFNVDPHEPMKEACAKIDAALEAIAAKKAEIDELKNNTPEAACSACECAEAAEESGSARAEETEAVPEDNAVEEQPTEPVCESAEPETDTEKNEPDAVE